VIRVLPGRPVTEMCKRLFLPLVLLNHFGASQRPHVRACLLGCSSAASCHCRLLMGGCQSTVNISSCTHTSVGSLAECWAEAPACVIPTKRMYNYWQYGSVAAFWDRVTT